MFGCVDIVVLDGTVDTCSVLSARLILLQLLLSVLFVMSVL